MWEQLAPKLILYWFSNLVSPLIDGSAVSRVKVSIVYNERRYKQRSEERRKKN